MTARPGHERCDGPVLCDRCNECGAPDLDDICDGCASEIAHEARRDDIGQIVVRGGSRFYVTDCCGSAVSVDEHGATYCKGCYREVDAALGAVPPSPFTDSSPFFRDSQRVPLRDGDFARVSAEHHSQHGVVGIVEWHSAVECGGDVLVRLRLSDQSVREVYARQVTKQTTIDLCVHAPDDLLGVRIGKYRVDADDFTDFLDEIRARRG